MQSAAIMINYTDDDTGSINDVISIPVNNMTPADLVRLQSSEMQDRYRTLFESSAVFNAPISMSTLITSNYDDIDWHDENDKVNHISSHSSITRVSLNISYGNNNVYTIEFPMPTELELDKLFGYV